MIHEMTDETIMADASRLHTEAHASARAVLDVQGLGKHVTLPGGELTVRRCDATLDPGEGRAT